MLDVGPLVSARQVHGNAVFQITRRPELDLEVDGYDAFITSAPGVLLMVQQADCQAVFFFDPIHRAIGLAHAGWRGSVAGILPLTIHAMAAAFDSRPRDMLAAISPSLGPCCAEFIHFQEELPETFHRYQVRPAYFDFWAISRDQLLGCGIPDNNITVAGICTRCSQDYFSYRRHSTTGRSASVIGLV